MPSPLFLLKAAALSGVFVVAIGAFGAHALKAHLDENMLRVYQTGVQYQMFHTLALLFLGLFLYLSPAFQSSTQLRWCGIFFVVGIILFPGSLYALSVSGVKWLGMITPLGGASFIAGWVCLFLGLSENHT
ncbi:MAG: DUF423 domain-containing protein [Agarilytica sp.]